MIPLITFDDSRDFPGAMSSFSKQIWVVHPLNPSKVFSDPPFWVLSYDWSLLLFSYNQVIPPKFSPPPQGINNDQSLTTEYIHVPEPSSLFRVDSEESHESAHTWLFAIPPKLAKVSKGKSLSTLGARGFSCAVSGFFSRRSCLRPKAEDVSACGRRSSSSLEKKNLWYPG